MSKNKAPASLTGGAGCRFEDYVAARFHLDSLAGTNSLGSGFGRITQVDWQAQDGGWLADDLYVSCEVSSTQPEIGLSIKSDRQVTKTSFPKEFVAICWSQ